ncbi:MAG: hypothetical protein ACYDEX_04135 [Mobilitalea sp.]
MKLQNKFFAGFAATVLALSMMVGTAMAATPIFTYDAAAGAKEDAKSTVICELMSGGGNQDGMNGPVYADLQAIATQTASVDVLLTGNFTGTAHLNLVGDFSFTPTGDGYDNKTYAAKPITVDGFLVYSGAYGEITADARFAFLLRDKSEGAAALEAYIFRDADGEIVGGQDGAGFLTAAKATSLFNSITGVEEEVAEEVAEEEVAEVVEEEAAPAEEAAVPQTGVVSVALLFGLGAAAFGTGSVVLKKKER